MIAVDWGTTRCRAYRLRGGTVVERRESESGILEVATGAFDPTLRALIGPWLREGESRVVLGGMVGSRSGWIEAPYMPCPVSVAMLATSLVRVPFEGASVRLVPGVSGSDAAGVPEFMRGEETQIFGADISTGTLCLPGSHSKWVRVADNHILEFSTYLTGEAFAALRRHTILARSIVDGPIDVAAFDAGVARSTDAGGLLHHLFGVRALGLIGQLGDVAGGSYLSGLLIGHEARGALPTSTSVHVIGATHLTELYARALQSCGADVRRWGDDTAALGLNRIAEVAPWN